MYENDTLFQKSLKKAYGGGISGALAMSTQVTTLMVKNNNDPINIDMVVQHLMLSKIYIEMNEFLRFY